MIKSNDKESIVDGINKAKNTIGITIISIVFDFYILKALVNIIIALFFILGLYPGFTDVPIWEMTAKNTVLIFSAFIVTIYHILISKEINFLSIGEKVVGRRSLSKVKYYVNPYKINRIGLFIVITIALILAQYEVDGFKFDNPYNYDLAVLLGISFRFALQVFGIYLSGMGFSFGLVISTLTYLNYFRISIHINELFSTAIVYMLLAVLNITIGIYFWKNRLD